MTDTTTYTATITITSIGDDNSINVGVSTDPSAVPRVKAGKGLPAAYEAARDIQRFIDLTTKQRRSFNMNDHEFNQLDEDSQMAAIRAAAEEASSTIRVVRHPVNVE